MLLVTNENAGKSLRKACHAETCLRAAGNLLTVHLLKTNTDQTDFIWHKHGASRISIAFLLALFSTIV